ncbi:MAG: small multi-drug export protein [Patescibacteria group bacterium]
MWDSHWWIVALAAMTPLGELRIAIPLGIGLYGLSPLLTFVLAVAGNAVPVILLYFCLEPVTRWLRRLAHPIDRFFTWLFAHTYHRHSAKFDRYGSLALLLFVAIPLPLTGGWTGALLAYLFGIKWHYALPNLLIGVILAGIIVTFLTLGGVWIFGL